MLHQDSKRCGDRWLGAKVLWKNGGNVHPRAHGQCKGPGAGTSWECTRRTHRPKGGRAGVRNTQERWLGHTRRDLDAQLGVWELPPGVECAEALGNFHSRWDCCRKSRLRKSGRKQGGNSLEAAARSRGTARQLRPGWVGRRPSSPGPSHQHVAHPGVTTQRPPDDQDGYIGVPQRQTWGSPSPSALFQHPLHHYVLNALQQMTQHQRHILSWEYQWNRGFGGFVTCSFSKPTFKYLLCLGLSVSSQCFSTRRAGIFTCSVPSV